MIKCDHWWLPEGERHLSEWMVRENLRIDGRLTYQYTKYAAALERCGQTRVAVDIGAHVGLWSYWMVRDFETVHAFEPKPEHGECWARNVPLRTGVHFHGIALGAAAQRVGLLTKNIFSSGNTWVRDGSDVEMRTLDSLGLTDVDLMKIDCEGYEYDVLLGAQETIARCRPVLIVEQKTGGGRRFGHHDLDGVRLLLKMGAEQLWNIGGDFVMTFPEAA